MQTDLVDLGSSPAVTCPHDAPVSQAARMMSELDIGWMVVIDDSHTLVGVLTDRDIALRIVGRDLPSDTPVHEAMTREVASIIEHASVLDAVRQMATRNCRRLPVVDEHGMVRAVIALDDIYMAAGELLGQIDTILNTEHQPMRRRFER